MQKLLIIDDDLLIPKLVASVAVQRGLAVVIESDGAKALDAIRREHPDIVLLDIMLPGKSGLDILKLKDSDEEISGIPVIAYTNLTAGTVCGEALAKGARQCLIKDQFKPAELVDMVLQELETQSES